MNRNKKNKNLSKTKRKKNTIQQKLCYSYSSTGDIKTWNVMKDIRKQPPEVFCEKCVLKNSTKFTGKHLCQSLFSIKLQA